MKFPVLLLVITARCPSTLLPSHKFSWITNNDISSPHSFLKKNVIKFSVYDLLMIACCLSTPAFLHTYRFTLLIFVTLPFPLPSASLSLASGWRCETAWPWEMNWSFSPLFFFSSILLSAFALFSPLFHFLHSPVHIHNTWFDFSPFTSISKDELYTDIKRT